MATSRRAPQTDAEKQRAKERKREAERRERNEMYFVNSEIFAMGTPLPRFTRTDAADRQRGEPEQRNEA